MARQGPNPRKSRARQFTEGDLSAEPGKGARRPEKSRPDAVNGRRPSAEPALVLLIRIRNSARTCGQISVTQHFDAWAKAGMPLGKMDQVQILLEVGGGVGSAEFPIASATVSNP